MTRKKRYLFLPVFILFALLCRGNQDKPGDPYRYYTGFKYQRNYTALTYGASNQNWAVLQDPRGILYFANQAGVLEYDGTSWEFIDIPNHTVRSMDRDADDADDADGTIYIGGMNEIGYLQPGDTGKLKYVSLLPHLENQHHNFAEVYQTYCDHGTTWFRSYKKLFRWRDGKFKVWDTSGTKTDFKIIFSWKGKCFVQRKSIGIVEVIGDSFQKLPGNKIFEREKIYMAVPYKNGKLFVGTRIGFFIYDGTEAVRFPTEADSYLKGKRLSHGIRLANGDFAAATLNRGLVVFDDRGRLKAVFNGESCPMPDDSVKYVLEDSRGSLWLGLNNGITRIDYASPAYLFGPDSGLKGLVLCAARHKGRFYAGTSSGLYYLETPAPGTAARFRPVPGINGGCKSLLSVGPSLLAASAQALVLVEDPKTVRKIIPNITDTPFVLEASRTVPLRVWVGTDNSVFALKRENNRWREEFRVQCPRPGIRSCAEDNAGNLWLGTVTTGVMKIDSQQKVLHFDETHQLPKGEVYAARAAGRVLFATAHGIYRFDSAARAFVPDPVLGETFSNSSRGVFRLVQTPHRHIWFHSRLENFHAAPAADSSRPAFTINKVVFPMTLLTQVNAIYPDLPMIWFACSGGLICYDTSAPPPQKSPFSALVRKITIKGRDQETIAPVLDYDDRNLRFDAAAPFFEGTGKVWFRYFMEGYDRQWSDWLEETFKNYINLPPRTYTFRVQARDVYENLSREGRFSFEILPPWYLTWWGLLIFVFLLLLIGYLTFKWWRYRKLVVEKQRLEKIVEERTREINLANAQLRQKTVLLEDQSEQLKEMDKVKSRFFANISHEFRTPLSLIMGPLDQIRSETPDLEIKKRSGLAYRNAQRLLGLINQLLDLAKAEGGKLKLQAEERDLTAFLKALLEPFVLAARRQRTELVFFTEAPVLPLYFDVEKMEKIMTNLLSNALKFTPPDGKITVSVTPSPAYVEISVTDTGPGISPDQLEHVFDRFYQAHGTVEHRQKGSGIGLSLTKELVELHHGRITVSSPGEDRGAEFTVRLPLGCQHLSAAEVADRPREAAVEVIETGEALEIEETGDDAVPDAGAVPSPNRGKEVILVVEDNADLRYYISTSLGPDYIVEEAKDGLRGIEKAKEIIPDLIISDIMMPRADGYELCRAVKSDIATSHIPVVLLTAKTSEASILQGLETGADDYITKPFNTRVLVARVKNLIDLRRQLQLSLNREMVMQPSQMAMSKMDREFFEDLQQVIDKNLSDPDFNVEELSRRLYMSRTTLYRKIQALSGETPTDFIRSYRLKRAAQLFKRAFGSVTEVAFEVGFSSRAYFTKCFKEKFHRLPSDFSTSFDPGGREIH